MDIRQLHKIRIKNDYEQMCRLKTSPMIDWVAVKGTAPYIEEYLLTINVRTYKAQNVTMNQVKVRIKLDPTYPDVAPVTKMEGTLVYHPHWFTDGRFCCGTYVKTQQLGDYVVAMIQSLQYDHALINPRSPANYDAMKWYLDNKNNRTLFPCDKQVPPNPNGSNIGGFTVIKR